MCVNGPDPEATQKNELACLLLLGLLCQQSAQREAAALLGVGFGAGTELRTGGSPMAARIQGSLF